MRIYPVILCGGSGTRLWPASRPSRPKQFIALIGDRSLFQNTVLRLRGLTGGQAPIIVAGARHTAEIEHQLATLGVEGVVIAEPEGRDSAPAIAAAAAWIVRQDPQGVAVVVASDHHIPDAAAFRASVEVAAAAAAAGRIVTFGVMPDRPATAYGYIQPGEALNGAPGVFALARFIEKPDLETARAYVAAGHLWNSGNFVFAVQTLLDELTRHAPSVAAAAVSAIDQAERAGAVVALGEAFRTAPKVSIDYAVMEKTDRAAVLPVDFSWSDLGAWDAVWAASTRDEQENVVSGDTLLIDSRGCLVRNGGKTLITLIGARNLAIVAEPDTMMVCDLDASQDVKTAVDRIRADGRAEVDIPAARQNDIAILARDLALWLHASALPIWWALGADRLLGGFHEALNEEARPVAAPRRARVQARQIYSFAAAGELGWAGPWREAVEHGLDFFQARYLREDGLYRTLVGVDGAPLDETAMLYDQAFALLALASASKALPERAAVLEGQAQALVDRLRQTRSAGCGFIEAADETPHRSNPHMHLFEALLAWEALRPEGRWGGLADEIGELALDKFIDAESGALREFFDPTWAPAPGPAGDLVEPGHQFEWAWLLERWGRARARNDARAAARRLFQIGTIGVDEARGVAINALHADLSVRDAGARLWPQTEWLKAALILRETAGGAERQGFERQAAAAAAGLERYLAGVVPGLWRDKLRADGEFVAEPAPASSLYHIVCAIAELKVRA